MIKFWCLLICIFVYISDHAAFFWHKDIGRKLRLICVRQVAAPFLAEV